MVIKNNTQPALFLFGSQLILQYFILRQLVESVFLHRDANIWIFSIIFLITCLAGLQPSKDLLLRQLRLIAPYQILTQFILFLIIPITSYYLNHNHSFILSQQLDRLILYPITMITIILSSTAIHSSFLPLWLQSSKPLRGLQILISGFIGGFVIVLIFGSYSIVFFLSIYLLLSILFLTFLAVPKKSLILMVVLGGVLLINFNTINRKLSDWVYKYKYRLYPLSTIETKKYTLWNKYEIASLANDEQLLLINGDVRGSHSELTRDQYFLITFTSSFLNNPAICLINQPLLPDYSLFRKNDLVLHHDPFLASIWFPKIGIENPNFQISTLTPTQYFNRTDIQYDLIAINFADPEYLNRIGLNKQKNIFNLCSAVNSKGILAIKLPTDSFTNEKYIQILEYIVREFSSYFTIHMRNSLYFFAQGNKLADIDEYTIRQRIIPKYHKNVKVNSKGRIDFLIRKMNN
ncbi:MAG: hypothetical protein H8E14_12365 [Candidatus Marinimicrobia bacterium]|nr:hypothetical protein [Candidatus Neomarinimicrobiota bacterium]